MKRVVVLAVAVMAACSDTYGTDPKGDPGDGGGPAPGQDDVEITPTDIDFGAVTCGATPTAPRIVTIRNKSATGTAHYTVQIPQGAPFDVGGTLTGDLAPSAVTSISVTPKPDRPGDNATAIVVIAGSALAQIGLKANADGGRLEITPSIADLGDVRFQNGGSLDVSLANTGTKAVSLIGIDSSSADFQGTWTNKPTALVIGPASSQSMTVKLGPGDQPTTQLDGQLTLHVDGPLCGALPTLPVKGKRVSLDVTMSPADFGKQYCNATPALTRDVVISNYTGSALGYTASLRGGATSPFVIKSGGSGSVAPGTTTTPATAAITIGMKAVGGTVAPLSEIVDVNVTGVAAPSGGARTATATADIHGVVITIQPAMLTGFQYNNVKYYSITNGGNDTAQLSYSFVRDSGTVQVSAWINQIPSSIAAGANPQAAVQFHPDDYNAHGTFAGTFTFTSTNASPICNAAPTLHVDGTH